jgi:glycosyltransferase involved in cell wall biosynthesis
MKILMFGWEFPPLKSGGLGTACYDLTKGLSRQGVDVTFVMPTVPDGTKAEFVKLVGANRILKNVRYRKIKSILTPYMSSQSYADGLHQVKVNKTSGSKDIYGKNIYEEVYRYGEAAKEIALDEEFDIIHVHDWMTYRAGMNAKSVSGKPLVAHIHATEGDRTGGNPNTYIKGIEYEGLKSADMIIANSNYTKNNVMREYGIDAKKIEVVHWGIDPENPYYKTNYKSPINKEDKIVLFLGRVTIQKGPDYFIKAAKIVSEHVKNAKFVIAGNGDMLPRIVEEATSSGIADKVIFTGFLSGADVHKAFQMADLYVMPSVSEPFGLVALESMKNNTPVLMSKQSGVSEVVNHALKVDFWDIKEMANKIIGVLQHTVLQEELTQNSFIESQKFNLDEPARKTIECYAKLLR